MQAWLTLVPSILIAMAILTIPGWSLAALGGVRGFVAIAAGVPVSVGVVTIAAMLAPVAGLEWSIAPVAGLWALLALLVGGVRLSLRKPAIPAPPRAALSALSGVAIGGVLTVLTLTRTVGQPDNFSLRFDNVFHLNAVRFALDSGNASSFSIGGVTSAGTTPDFYPAAWHGLVSLVSSVTGSPIAQSVNALNIAVAVAAWVAGGVLLGQLLTPRILTGSIVGGIASSALPVFPVLMLEWGVLYPNYLAFALLPTMIALLAVALRVSGVETPVSRPAAAALLVAGLPGLTLAHPNGALTLGLLIAVLFCLQVSTWLVRTRPTAPRAGLGVGAMLLVLVVTVLVWVRARPSLDLAPWHKVQSTGQALGEVFTNSAMQRPFSLLVSVAMAVGLVLLITRRQFAFPLTMAATTVLFVASSAFADGWLRAFLAGPFYQDNYRLASLTAVSALPLVIVGGLAILDVIERAALRSRWAQRRGPAGRAHPWVRPVLGAVLAVVAIIGTQFGGMQRAAIEARPAYERTATSELVDTDEYRLMMELPELLPDGAVLVDNPGTGSAFAYALTGFPVTAAHMFYESSEAEATLRTGLNRAARSERTQAAVCSAVDDLGGDVYVLDFVDPAGERKFAGLENLRAPVVDVVQRYGNARLLRVSVCD